MGIEPNLAEAQQLMSTNDKKVHRDDLDKFLNKAQVHVSGF